MVARVDGDLRHVKPGVRMGRSQFKGGDAGSGGFAVAASLGQFYCVIETAQLRDSRELKGMQFAIGVDIRLRAGLKGNFQGSGHDLNAVIFCLVWLRRGR